MCSQAAVSDSWTASAARSSLRRISRAVRCSRSNASAASAVKASWSPFLARRTRSRCIGRPVRGGHLAALTHHESGGKRVVPSPAGLAMAKRSPRERWNDRGRAGLIPHGSAGHAGALREGSWTPACRDPMVPSHVVGVEGSVSEQNAQVGLRGDGRRRGRGLRPSCGRSGVSRSVVGGRSTDDRAQPNSLTDGRADAHAQPLDTSTWTTYVSKRYGFSIAHPADWTPTSPRPRLDPRQGCRLAEHGHGTLRHCRSRTRASASASGRWPSIPARRSTRGFRRTARRTTWTARASWIRPSPRPWMVIRARL